MHILAVLFAAYSVGCFIAAAVIKHRSRSSMQPSSYTVLSAHGPHATVVLFPQPYGKGIDRLGNTYRIVGDTAHPIED